MLTYRKPVCLSLASADLPVRCAISTAGTLYQRDDCLFHLMLKEPEPLEPGIFEERIRTLWLEISPDRVILTAQGNASLSYRHLWERQAIGKTRYWLRNSGTKGNQQMRLQNYTHALDLAGDPYPARLRLEYDLRADRVALGRYVLNLEVHS